MKTRIVTSLTVLFLAGVFIISACNKDSDPDLFPNSKIEIVLNEIPFTTDDNVRIGYTLKTWEYENDGLQLQKIIVLNADNNEELIQFKVDDFRRIYKDPIPPTSLFEWNKLDSYYISIQLPIPLDVNIPSKISHKMLFQDTINNTEVSIYGGDFIPRIDESPMIIASPIKGERLVFMNVSVCNYHFDALMFIEGKIYSPERFAFDNTQLDPTFSDSFVGDPTLNESYSIYRDTLYAVADGIVEKIADGRVENSGNLSDAPLPTADDYGGNYLILKIASDRYAYYCHIVPSSFLVAVGDNINEGDPIALLGNSGNSTEPHLHFHVSDSPDLWRAKGVSIVLKNYTRIGNYYLGMLEPKVYENAMTENFDIVEF